jgi:hypothetical protein
MTREEIIMQSKRNGIGYVLAGTLAAVCTQTAFGVTLNTRGEGQVLLFPYYTANANNNTLISIVNTQAIGKALRVRFAEGENGRDAYSLNVYLGPYDTWPAAIGQSVGTSVATLVSSDSSCTVPGIPLAGVQFSNAAFSGANADPGDSGLSRTLEGSIEVIEMGTIVRNSLTDQALGKNCEFLIEGWSPPGFFISADNPAPYYWHLNPDTDLLNPTGGLYGTGYIVNVEQGTIFAYDAAALGGFRSDPLDQPRGTKSSVVLHTAPGNAHPNLADALSDPATNIVVAEAEADDGHVTATYPALSQAIDAVSAVLMASTIANDYEADPGAGATTNFIFSYPTRRFYTDAAIVGDEVIQPFAQLFAGIQNTVVEYGDIAFFDREGKGPPHGSCPAFGCLDPVSNPGTTVELLNFGAGADAILGSALNMDFARDVYLGPPSSSLVHAGRFFFSLALRHGPPVSPSPPGRRMLRQSIEGKYFWGLPVLGFGAQNLVNANVQNGVLANYSSAVTHRITAKCNLAVAGFVQATDPPCP